MSTTESADTWSPWLDFDKPTISGIPESAGVFSMHAAMKILFISASQNLRSSLLECMSKSCVDKAKRFRYMITDSPDKVKEQLIKDYTEKHNGILPLCMQNS
jgi:hypothetical protein